MTPTNKVKENKDLFNEMSTNSLLEKIKVSPFMKRIKEKEADKNKEPGADDSPDKRNLDKLMRRCYRENKKMEQEMN
jgi:hypothetical protein